MQPCGVCGGVGIDAAGYCTQCGTYRGLPAANPYGAPPPAGGPAYPTPTSGTPYSSPPVSGGGYPPAGGGGYPPAGGGYPPPGGGGYGPPPGGGNYAPPPTSGMPYSNYGGAYPPTSGAPAGYPGAYGSPTPTRSKNSFALPLVALSGTLVLIVIAIVVIYVVRKGDDTPPVAQVSASASPTISSAIDTCVLGTWRVNAISFTVVLSGGSSVQFTGSGGEAKFRPDGTAEYAHSGLRLSGSRDGATITISGSGTSRFTVNTSSNEFNTSGESGTGEWLFSTSAEPLSVNDILDGAKYTCTDSSLRATLDNSSGNLSITMSHTSKTA